MVVDEFRASIDLYRRLLAEESFSAYTLLNMVDKRLAQLSNHIAVIHRNIAERRAYAASAWFGGSGHLAEVAKASDILDQTIEVQDMLFEVRGNVLEQIAAEVQAAQERSS